MVKGILIMLNNIYHRKYKHRLLLCARVCTTVSRDIYFFSRTCLFITVALGFSMCVWGGELGNLQGGVDKDKIFSFGEYKCQTKDYTIES